MTSLQVQASDKILCAGTCGKSYTKDTLDKNDGVCGRCAKKTVNNTPDPSSVVTSLPSLIVQTLQAPQVFPNSSVANQLQLPNITNLSIASSDGKSIAAQNLTVQARLEKWADTAKKSKPTDLKLHAAIDMVVLKEGTATDFKKMEAITGVHLLALEKYWDAIRNLYLL